MPDLTKESVSQLPACGGLHRHAVRVLPAGRAEDQALTAQLPRLANPRVPVLHRPVRTLAEIPRPCHHEETGQQGWFPNRKANMKNVLFYFLLFNFILKQHTQSALTKHQDTGTLQSRHDFFKSIQFGFISITLVIVIKQLYGNV